MSETVKKEIVFRPRDVGSRRVNAEQIRSLIEALQTKGHLRQLLSVRCFGRDGRYDYPPSLVHEAIQNYEVRRIEGFLHFDEIDTDLSIDLDSYVGIGSSDECVFRVYGPIDEADRVATIINEHFRRWPGTGHGVYHHVWFWIIVAILGMQGLWVGPLFGGRWGFVFAITGLYVSFASYCIIFKADSWSPFIWFFRTGSPIERKRHWLPRIAYGAVFLLLAEAAGNALWDLLAG